MKDEGGRREGRGGKRREGREGGKERKGGKMKRESLPKSKIPKLSRL